MGASNHFSSLMAVAKTSPHQDLCMNLTKIKHFIIKKLGGIPLEELKPEPRTLRQQMGDAVVELMVKKDITFTKMMKLSGMNATTLWRYLIGDRRATPWKHLDHLEDIATALDSHWIGPRFVFYDDEVPKTEDQGAQKEV